MKRYRYINTDCFKVGEEVWVTGIKFQSSGRVKYQVKPTLCKIKRVTEGSIEVDGSNLNYYFPRTFYLDTPEKNFSWGDEVSINVHIAKTKEEAIEIYNFGLISEIEERYEKFRHFESSAKYRLL